MNILLCNASIQIRMQALLLALLIPQMITCLISCEVFKPWTHSWISLLSQSCAALLWRTWAQSAFVQDPAGVPAAHRKLVVINRRIPVVLRDVLIVSRRQRGARGSRAWEGKTDTYRNTAVHLRQKKSNLPGVIGAAVPFSAVASTMLPSVCTTISVAFWVLRLSPIWSVVLPVYINQLRHIKYDISILIQIISVLTSTSH